MIRIVIVIAIVSHPVMGQGIDAQWPTAAKNGFGTSNTVTSKVWFTLANGVMTEVFFPTLDVPNVQHLQLLLVIDGQISAEVESRNTIHRLELLDSGSLSFRQINTAKNGRYTITKTYVTDPQRNTVLIDVEFDSRGAVHPYVYYDPSLNNSGMHDSAWTEGDALIAVEGNKASALLSSCGFAENGNGFLNGIETEPIGLASRVDNGNVIQLGRIKDLETKKRCTLALGFGEKPAEAVNNARASLAKGFERVRSEYDAGWRSYVLRLPRIARHQRQFDMAAMVLQALEDKTFRGAVIASPSTPWGGGANANEPTVSGYHGVWSRDIYHVATAFDAIGDRAAAKRLLDYLFRVQQKPDGSFPQNTWVDGRPIGNGLQMDQVALPLVLAYQLGRNDRRTWLKHVKPAADFLLSHGPGTDQDRWEEKPGYSPATIAAEIAGLVCAAEIARINGDPAGKKYLESADNWAQNVERWTVTSGHYLRITENDDPNDGAKMEINSSSRVVDERTILDAGFLELVRLGVKRPRDPAIVESLNHIDQLIKVETPAGEAWYRYNHDAYGETVTGGKYDGRNGVGRLWTLLTGERGEYELAAGDLQSARKRLDTLAAFANDGLMLPEQVWDRNGPCCRLGTGTGSATPLAWSMAQFIRLAMSIQEGRNLETPRVVWERYVSSRAKAQRRRERRKENR